MSTLTKWYPHRPNEDGTYDSICPTCTRTVAREMSEANLVEAETLHKCPGLSPSLAKRIEQPMVPAQILAIAALRTLIDVHQIEETRLRAILADYPAFIAMHVR